MKRVDWLTGSKTAKLVKGGLRRTQSEGFCDQIRFWNTGTNPKYEAVKISSSSLINATYPVVVKLAGTLEGDTSATGIILGLGGSNYNTSNSLNIIEVSNDGTRYYRTRVIASLKSSEAKSLDNWQDTGNSLIVRVRESSSSEYSIVELNYDNAVPNDSMTDLIMCGYQGWVSSTTLQLI